MIWAKGNEMAELSVEEAKEIIGGLLDLVEECLVLCAAYKLVATLEGKEGWGVSR
jgi:hypothetical protein